MVEHSDPTAAMTPDSGACCRLCSARIDPQEYRDGAAIRVGNDFVCPSCVDQLPADAQVRINQIRAVRGMAATTYRVAHPRFPDVVCYSFSTTAQMMHHRRALRQGADPELPLIGRRSGPRTAAQIALGDPRAVWLGLAIGAGIATCLALLLVIGLGGADDDEPAITEQTPLVTAAPPPTTRADLPTDSLEAWRQANDQLTSADPLLQELAEELLHERQGQLDKAATALADGRFMAAEDLLDRSRLDAHPLLAEAIEREADLRQRLLQAREAQRRAAEARRREAEAQAAAAAAAKAEAEARARAEAEAEAQALAAAAEAAEAEGDAGDAPSGSGPRWSGWASDLFADQEPPTGWQATNQGGVRLAGPGGSLTRSIDLPAGEYAVWIYFRDPLPDSGQLNVRLGDTECILPRPPTTSGDRWLRIGTDDIPIAEAGTYPLFLFAQGGAWEFSRLQVADASYRAISSGKDAAELPWTGLATADPEPASPPEPVPHVRHLRPQSDTDAESIPADHPRLKILEALPPAGFPARVLASVRTYRKERYRAVERRGRGVTKMHAVVLTGPPIDCRDGGFGTIVHALRPERTTIDLIALDADGFTLPLGTFPLDDQWKILLPTMPAVPSEADFDPSRVTGLVIADSEAHEDMASSAGFVVGRAVAVSHRPPTEADLGLQPPTLLPITNKDLDKLIRSLMKPRSRVGTSWDLWFEPRRFRFLHGHHLITPAVRTEVRSLLADVLDQRTLPNGAVEKLVLQDMWLDGEFIIDPVVLDAEHHHVVLVATGGAELLIGLTVEQAVENFYRKLLDECIGRGVLPIIAIGPNKVNEDQRAACEQIWERFIALRAVDYPGVPVIDLREAAVDSAQRFGSGGKARFLELLGSGVSEIIRRLDQLAHERQEHR